MQIKCSTKAQKQLSTDRSPLELNVKHEYIPDLNKLLISILGGCPFWLILEKKNIQMHSNIWSVVNMPSYNETFIVAVSFIGGGSRSTRRKPPTCHKSLTSFIT